MAAFALRAGLAGLTELAPIFPRYYYTDAEVMDAHAWNLRQSWRRREPAALPGSPSQRAQSAFLAAVYSVFGHVPLAGKLVNALLACLALALLFGLFRDAFGPGPALGACWLAALWPSHVFFTSQNFKDALVMTLCYGALAGLLGDPARGRPAARLAGGLGCAILLGLLRPYLLLVLTASTSIGLLWALFDPRRAGRSRGWTAAALACALAAPALFRPLSKALFSGPLAVPGRASEVTLLPAIEIPGAAAPIRPISPQGISEFRRLHQRSDAQWAHDNRSRAVGTQLFYGLRLQTWLDVLLFLPKGVFYVLFMPLPLLYPLDGNFGRWLAAGENVALLGLAMLAAVGAWRGRADSRRGALLIFFIAMAVGSALLEFDLGSATRHRLLYASLLFPFAFSALIPPRRMPSAGRRKVFEVLECGGPGGTGNQVAAICNGLGAPKFEIGLVYASRDSDPQAYRALASGASRAFFVPEMVREVSPWLDAKAFFRLRRLFLSERPDVVHAHSSKAGVLARAAAWSAGVPKIFYSPRGYGFLQLDRPALSRAAYRAVELAVSWIGEIVAVSPSEAALARPLAHGRTVHTICDPFLGDPPEPRTVPARQGAVVAGCGRLAAARSPDAFVNLAQRLTDSRNGLRCVWIGGGEEEARVRRDLENMNLGAKVEITGWLDRPKVLERLAACDVFVHYSRWDALPNAVLEAMALGLPVVASDVLGCRDAVVHGKTGFIARDEVELLELCLKLVDDPRLRRTLGDAGRERVRTLFSLPEALARLEALYLS